MMSDEKMLTKVEGATSGFAAYMILYERVDQCCRMCGEETRKRVCDSCKMLVSRNRNKELTCKKNRKCRIKLTDGGSNVVRIKNDHNHLVDLDRKQKFIGR